MIRISKLKNGMRLITDSDEKAQTVSIGVWVGVGARFETAENNGISHVLEHMAFKGTKTRSAYDISSAIENVGGIMNVGFEKVFLMQNQLNKETSDIIATYTYQVGIINSQMSFSSAIGLFNSGINCILLLAVNFISKKLSDTSLW